MHLINRSTSRISATIPRVLGVAFISICAAFPCLHAQQPAPGFSPAPASIHFGPQSIPFSLNVCETPQRHVPETMEGGVALFDYNNDGNLDIFFTNGADISSLKKTGPQYWNRLFRNNGDGTFTDVTEKAGLTGTGYDTAVAIGDYDNDGYEDIFVGGVYRNTLYHNNGDGTFTDVTEKAGLARLDKQYGPLWSTGAAWVDVNNDGKLDLFVVNYLSWDQKNEPVCNVNGKPDYCHPRNFKALPNQLFLNNGDGTFTDVSEPSGIRAHPGKGMGVAIGDFDGTGLPGIFVTNDKFFNFLFRNKGNLHFEEVAFEAGVALPEHGNLVSGMGTDSQDLNNDGLQDIAFSALVNETFPLFQNDGKGEFTEVTARTGMTALSSPMSGYSINIADFDNDGWKDIFVARGDVQSPAMSAIVQIDQPNSVFHNESGNHWTALTEAAGFGAIPASRHRGAAVGDLNHDGKLDVVVTALSAPAEVWINNTGNQNHWLEIALTGTKSNRDGIGSRIRILAGGKTQTLYKSTASGYASSSAGPVHFGLGSSIAAEEVEIRWPSGTVQLLKNVVADRILQITEPK